MLYLTCLPCGDSVECNANTELKILANDNHQEHNHQSEACSPFCSCSCCPASPFYSTQSPTLQASKTVFLSDKFLILNEDADSEIFSSIWQPPQLS